MGCIGFGGPPTHVALLRRLCVDERKWITAEEFEDGLAATNLLPGPASTQLAIFCAWRMRGAIGAFVGGLCFIVPGLAIILALSAVFLAPDPPNWILGCAAGAGAAVPAVAVRAAVTLVPTSWKRIGLQPSQRIRWIVYAAGGAAAAATAGPYLVLVLGACGLVEVAIRRRGRPRTADTTRVLIPAVVVHVAAAGGLGALVWVAVKVGALSYGGGFVIIPLMQHDAVTTYHWMTGAQFLNAVALGQVTPGPVVQTVAVVGYAAAGVAGGLLAAVVAFAPSFLFVLCGGPRFQRIRANSGLPHGSRAVGHRCHCRFGRTTRPRSRTPMAARHLGARISLVDRPSQRGRRRCRRCRRARCRCDPPRRSRQPLIPTGVSH